MNDKYLYITITYKNYNNLNPSLYPFPTGTIQSHHPFACKDSVSSTIITGDQATFILFERLLPPALSLIQCSPTYRPANRFAL